MNKESLRKHLAEKVMGWEIAGEVVVISTPGVRLVGWKPDENIEQAFMCLDTFDEGYEIFVEGDVKRVIVYGEEDEAETEVFAREEAGGSLPMAISLACARATGYGD